jgi:hypothetical protein
MQQDICNLENMAYVRFIRFGSGSGSPVEEAEERGLVEGPDRKSIRRRGVVFAKAPGKLSVGLGFR